MLEDDSVISVSDEVAALARFRRALRHFLRFSEVAARDEGITPQQHQLMLAIAGLSTSGGMTIGELAEALQMHHNATVQLIDRAEGQELVQREADVRDRRVVRVTVTPHGNAILARLTALHHDELRRLRADILPLLNTIE